MKNSKLYEILSVFDKYEQNRCRKYVQSPYFNANDELEQLFETLIDHINENPEEELCKEELWCVLQPSKRYDDVRFRKYCSDLLKLIQGFLAQEVYEENPIHQATYLIEGVRKKKLDRLYNSTIKSARRQSEKQKHRSSVYYYNEYQIERNYYELIDFDTNRSARSNIDLISKNLDDFYFGEKLRYLCERLNRKTEDSSEYQILFIDEIIAHLEQHDYQDVPPVAIYYHIYLALLNNDDDSYFKLKKLLSQYGDLFPPDEAWHIYTFALNFCAIKVNKGSQHYLNEYYDLYVDLMNKKLIFDDGQLAPWHFKNIVTVALRLGKYDWTEEFINSNSAFLPESYRDNAVTYNLAQVYFYQKEYSKVIQLLQEVEYEDTGYNLGSKAMLLAIYYETDEIEPLYSLMDSFRTFLNRHKDIPERRRVSYKNLIKFTKRLTRILPGDKKSLEKVKHEIGQVKNVASIAWLKEKVAELEN